MTKEVRFKLAWKAVQEETMKICEELNPEVTYTKTETDKGIIVTTSDGRMAILHKRSSK